MPVIIISEREQKISARMEGLRAFLTSLRVAGDISHFTTVNGEIRVWVEDTVGQPADIILSVSNMVVYVVSGPCRVLVGKGFWKLPKYGFQKPLPKVRPIMKSLCDSLATIF